ncbi:MAG: helix-turn-helix domain-containing protein [Desulfococcaceae bacterium]
MKAHIKHQVIEKEGMPLFVVVPYQEYLEKFSFSDDNLYLPNEVVKAHAIDGKPLIRAWREYKGITQSEMAKRMGISRSAYSRTENSAKPQEHALKKAAQALGIDWQLLCLTSADESAAY